MLLTLLVLTLTALSIYNFAGGEGLIAAGIDVVTELTGVGELGGIINAVRERGLWGTLRILVTFIFLCFGYIAIRYYLYPVIRLRLLRAWRKR